MDPNRKNDDQKPSTDDLFAKIKDVDRLKDLRRRPRCRDGSLDLRAEVNKGLAKHDEQVTDYYDPDDPKDNVPAFAIKYLLEQQQE